MANFYKVIQMFLAWMRMFAVQNSFDKSVAEILVEVNRQVSEIISQYKQTKDALEEKALMLDALKESTAEFTTNMNDLNRELTQKNQEQETNKQHLDSTAQTITDLNRTIKEIEEQKAQLIKRIQEIHTQILNLTENSQDTSALSEQLTTKLTGLRDLSKDLNAKTSEKARLEAHYQILASKDSQLTEGIAKLIDRIKEVAQSLSELEQQTKTITTTNENFASDVAARQKLIDTIRDDKIAEQCSAVELSLKTQNQNYLKEMYRHYKDMIHNTTIEAANQAELVESAGSNLTQRRILESETKTLLEQKEEEIRSNERELEDNRRALDAIKKRIKTHKEQVDTLEPIIPVKNRELRELSGPSNSLVTKETDAIDRLRTELTAIVQEFMNACELLQGAADEEKKLEINEERLISTRKRLKEEIKPLKSNVDSIKDEIMAAEKRHSQNKEKSRLLETNLERMQGIMQLLEGTVKENAQSEIVTGRRFTKLDEIQTFLTNTNPQELIIAIHDIFSTIGNLMFPHQVELKSLILDYETELAQLKDSLLTEKDRHYDLEIKIRNENLKQTKLTQSLEQKTQQKTEIEDSLSNLAKVIASNLILQTDCTTKLDQVMIDLSDIKTKRTSLAREGDQKHQTLCPEQRAKELLMKDLEETLLTSFEQLTNAQKQQLALKVSHSKIQQEMLSYTQAIKSQSKAIDQTNKELEELKVAEIQQKIDDLQDKIQSALTNNIFSQVHLTFTGILGNLSNANVDVVVNSEGGVAAPDNGHDDSKSNASSHDENEESATLAVDNGNESDDINNGDSSNTDDKNEDSISSSDDDNHKPDTPGSGEVSSLFIDNTPTLLEILQSLDNNVLPSTPESKEYEEFLKALQNHIAENAVVNTTVIGSTDDPVDSSMKLYLPDDGKIANVSGIYFDPTAGSVPLGGLLEAHSAAS